jgi:hypothetical protein
MFLCLYPIELSLGVDFAFSLLREALNVIIINHSPIELKSYAEFLLFTDKETLLQL